MKKLFSLSFLLALVAHASAASFNTVTVKDSISTNTTWTPGQQYLIKGWVYVTSGTTLTINAGTIIRGDKATKGTLIVERGAKIIAEGRADKPIIFTSNQPQGSRSFGDWGGIIICGKAPVNWTAGEAQVEGGPRSFYGGTNANDNSGKLTFVRIEFGGIAFSANNEVNGLTLAGVGNGTQIDHIQVSYSGDDGYEFFGGNVNVKYLISHRSWDDDFDSDNGYTGLGQFLVALRDPYAADVSGSKAIETDSYLAGTVSGTADNSKATKAVFTNCTFVGPQVNPGVASYDPQYVAAVHIRRGSSLSLYNSVIGGWPCGLLIDESSASYGSTTKNIGLNDLMFKSNAIGGMATTNIPAGAPNKNVVFVKDGARSLTSTTSNADSATSGNTDFTPYAGPFTFIGNVNNGNRQYASFQNGIRLFAPFDLTAPNFFPQSGSPIVINNSKNWLGQTISGLKAFDASKPLNLDTTSNYAYYNAPEIVPNFTDSKTNQSFFDKVNFIGAFDGNGSNWMIGWTNFDPNNTFYEYAEVGVNEVVSNIEAAVIYPNPAKTEAAVTVTANNNAELNITLVDVAGKTVQNVFAGVSNGTKSYSINIDNLNSGLYFVNIVSGESRKSLKLSVVK